MKNHCFHPILFILFVLLLLPNCARVNVDVEPDASAVYESLKLNFHVKNLRSRESQSFKAILKTNSSGDKMLFLSPLNQVYGMLFLNGENTLLINTRKKKYWQGEFNLLIRWLWGEEMDFQFSQFKELVKEGIIPADKVLENPVTITIEKVDTTNKPVRIQLQSKDILVKVKVSDRQTGKGKLQLDISLKGKKQADIRQVME